MSVNFRRIVKASFLQWWYNCVISANSKAVDASPFVKTIFARVKRCIATGSLECLVCPSDLVICRSSHQGNPVQVVVTTVRDISTNSKQFARSPFFQRLLGSYLASRGRPFTKRFGFWLCLRQLVKAVILGWSYDRKINTNFKHIARLPFVIFL